jgi:hypothetical protein
MNKKLRPELVEAPAKRADFGPIQSQLARKAPVGSF